jgi:maltose 6'-phosphate phosphatase
MLKLMTLNLHCFAEDNFIYKQTLVCEEIVRGDYDVVFFQEVAQSKTAPKIPTSQTVNSNEVKADNYTLILQQNLALMGHQYYLIYSVSNEAFGDYDEGLAMLSKVPFVRHQSAYVSKLRDYHDWRTRKLVIGDIKWNDQVIRLISVHLGWSDETEVFETQFKQMLELTTETQFTLFAGDFNIPDNSEAYSFTQHHLFDVTKGVVQTAPTHGPHRIDYIMTNHPVLLHSYQTLFEHPDHWVSDHRGLSASFEPPVHPSHR